MNNYNYFHFRYSPNTSEVLKFAWIQYIAFFAIVAFLLFRINSFIFRHQVIEPSVKNYFFMYWFLHLIEPLIRYYFNLFFWILHFFLFIPLHFFSIFQFIEWSLSYFILILVDLTYWCLLLLYVQLDIDSLCSLIFNFWYLSYLYDHFLFKQMIWLYLIFFFLPFFIFNSWYTQGQWLISWWKNWIRIYAPKFD